MIHREGGKTVVTLPKAAPHSDATPAGDAVRDASAAGADTLPADEYAADAPGAALPRATPPARMASAPGPFLPTLLVTLAVLGWLATQAWQLWSDRQALSAAHASQQQTVDNAAKLRSSLDGLAADTQRLAEAGNASARLLVDELRKRGVTINPNAPGK